MPQIFCICRMLIFSLLSACIAVSHAPDLFAATDKIKILALRGDVKVVRKGSEFTYRGTPGMAVTAGDVISVGRGSYVRLTFDENLQSMATVTDNSILIVKNGGPEKVELIQGQFVGQFNGLSGNEEFIVRTPAGICGGGRSGWSVSTDGSSFKVAVFENKAFLRGVDTEANLVSDKVWIDAGSSMRVRKGEGRGPEEIIPPYTLENFVDLVQTASEDPVVVRLEATPIVVDARKDDKVVEMNPSTINLDTY